MQDTAVVGCGQDALKALERVKYFPRQIIGVDDMVTETNYFLQKLRRHNLFLHGWGIVCGLQVIADPADGLPWRVRIDPGYALGPYGDEIYVPSPVFLDLAECGPGEVTDPCEPDRFHGSSRLTGEVFVAVRYAECLSRPVRAMSAGCGCEEEDCEYSRIRDSFQVSCLNELPPQPSIPELCELIKGPFVCPPCPADPWVVLARVALPARSQPIKTIEFDNAYRRQIYSTSVLQERLIRCCCKKEHPTQPEPDADVQVEIKAKASPDEIFYQITVTNVGPDPAENVVLTSDIQTQPAAQFVADKFNTAPPATPWQPMGAFGPFRAVIGTLAPQGSFKGMFRLIRFKLTTPVHGNSTVVTNTVLASSDTPDSDLSNNQKSVTNEVRAIPFS